MKRVVFSMIVVLVGQLAVAQTCGTVAGFVKEKASGAVVEYATVALHEAQTGQVVTGCTTDAEGHFQLTEIKPDTYYIESSFVGFRSVRSEVFTMTKGKTHDVGTLYIEDDAQALEEVVVESRKSTFVARLDRKVFNVGEDVMASSGSASDLMQNIPSVEVDMDGAVSLRGNDNVTILINGKPSAMMSTKTRSDALNQLPANSIERIEVITNPSAEYKPDGVSGIINIVLKKDAKAGLNGSLSGNVGSSGRNNVGLNMNYKLKGVNFFGGYTYRCDRYDRTIDDQRTSPTDFINQATYGLGRPVSHTLRLGMNADLSVHDQLELAGSYNHRRFQRNERVESETTSLDGSQSDFYLRSRDALAKENMWEGTLRYTHSYGKDNEWGVDYTYSSESEDEINRYETKSQAGDTKDNEGVWDANYLHVAKMHWMHRLSSSMKLSAGYEMEHIQTEQNYHVADWNVASFFPNTDRSSDFTHLRMLHSLYATAEADFCTWSLLAGLRGEYADIENRLLSLAQTSHQHYSNIYPTLHVSRRLGTHHELQLNYSLRVNRPEGSDMNPFAERINPLSLQAGNPDLKPEKIHSVEAVWRWRTDNGISLMSTLYYRYLTNQITEVSRYIEDGVLLTTKENLNTSQNAGVELIWICPVSHWLSLNWNVNGYYNQIDATRLGFDKRRDTFSWSTLLNANFTPLRHWMVQLNARLRGAQLVPQGRRDADCRINLGMKYDIPSTGLSLLATVTDLLDTYRKSYTLDTPELKQKVEKRRNPRIFYVGVSWQFGAGKGKKHQAEMKYDEGL